MYRSIIVFALITLVFWSCKDDMNQTGYDLLLPGDKISAHKVATSRDSISSFTVRDEILRTSKPEYNLLGTFVDPVFGKTTADFAVQFRLSEYPSYEMGHHVDSLVLYMTYDSFYGYTNTIQNFKAYELVSDLKAADTVTYFQNVDLKSLAAIEPAGEVNHRIHYDTVRSTTTQVLDTITYIRIKLKLEMAQKLMQESFAALSADKEDPNVPFLQAFKGLYIEAGDLSQDGAIAQATPRAIVMYTRKTDAPTDTVTSETYFYATKSSARVNRFVHDYSTTDFAANLDQMNQQDSLIYLQTTGGLSSRIKIEGLNDWKDSTSAAINKAELVFKVEGSTIDTVVFIPAPKIILSLIDQNGNIHTSKDNVLTQNYILPSDLAFSEAYYGGVYNPKDSTYRFNLAKYMQEIVKGKTENYGFYLSTYNKNAIYNRVVLKGATSKPGIRFDITYTKTN